MRGFEKLTTKPEAIIPKRATHKSAGYDLAIIQEITINPGETVLAQTGIKAYMQDDEVLKIYIRSSLGYKKNIRLANSVGIIDADYYNNANNEGHIMIPLHNFSSQPVTLQKAERVAQAIFEKYLIASDESDEFKTRSGGFGHTN